MKTVWLIVQDNSMPEHGSHNRHFYFAKHLKKRGYNPIVFVASKSRQSNEQMIKGKDPFLVDESHGFPFVYIRVNDYGSSMKKRLFAITEFHMRLWLHWRKFPLPDVVLGSSAYPLSPLLAIKIARECGARSICEVRDLWPLSLEEYGIIKRGGFIARAMYRLEHKLYREADALVFTMEGGAQYIRDKGWDAQSGGDVDLSKVFHINNGIDLEGYQTNLVAYPYINEEYTACVSKKIVYMGSIRKVNDLGFLIRTMKLLKQTDAELFLFGDGEQRELLERLAQDEGIVNVHFMGKVDKRYVPSVLDSATLLMIGGSSSVCELARYGPSQNKLFDYLASGKPLLSNIAVGYSIIESNECGFERRLDTPEDCARRIEHMLENPDALARWGKNARSTAERYSFETLTKMLVGVIEG